MEMTKTNEPGAEFAQNAFHNFMALFFQPEIDRRKSLQLIEKPFQLLAAQAIIFPDGRPPMIRLNGEVSADLKLKKGTDTTVKDFWPSSDDVLKIKLKEGEFGNCAHVTLVTLADRVQLVFDFTYNKEISTANLQIAKEFLATAHYALDNGLPSAFIDNAFSASELLAKTNLLLETNKMMVGKTNHSAIKSEFNKRHKLTTDAFDLSVKDLLNRLSDMRSRARYLNGTIDLEKLDREQALAVLDELYEKLLQRIGD
jgi:hypothetical protein